MKFARILLKPLAISLLILLTNCSKVEKAADTPIREHTISALLWQQNSAEYKALCYQSFNIARRNLENIQSSEGKPYAIITDIDETVLDNSPYNGMQVEKDKDYEKRDWIEWGKLEKAKALPGAVEFFNFADSIGVEVFYISNRYDLQLPETIENLKALNLPNADVNHVFLKTDSSDKQERRDKVLEEHEVLLYMGDNLSDFSALFDNQNTENRNNAASELRNDFGSKYIIFPNPMYGDWETKGIYESKNDWSNSQKDSIRASKIYSY
jgi:5'-nucleotidase (lipoprotein e(P4) family)